MSVLLYFHTVSQVYSYCGGPGTEGTGEGAVCGNVPNELGGGSYVCVCNLCVAGKWSNVNVDSINQNAVCQVCASDTSSNVDWPGTARYSAKGSVFCRDYCPAGTYPPDSTGACEPCAAGTYSGTNSELRPCATCPGGSTSPVKSTSI